MSHRLMIHWKSWLPVGATVLVAGLLVNAQAPEEKTDAAPGPAGSISGKVTAGRGISVVWLEAQGKNFPKPAKPFAISQKSLRFVPHVLMVPAGAEVDFQNGDDVQHNIFWPAVSGDKKLGHTLGTWPKGQMRKFEFTTPGIVPLLCNVHPEMSAYLIVTPTPYGAETDEAGSFKIPDVPGGSYTMKAWHEGFKTSSKPVMVASDVKVEFTLAK
jgi:plastocyanin